MINSRIKSIIFDGLIFSAFCLGILAYIALGEMICRALGVGA